MMRKGERRSHQLAVRRFHELEGESFGIETGGKRLAVELAEERLRIKSFEMARPAGHEQEDYALGLGWKVRRPRRQRVGVEWLSPGGREGYASVPYRAWFRGSGGPSPSRSLGIAARLTRKQIAQT